MSERHQFQRDGSWLRLENLILYYTNRTREQFLNESKQGKIWGKDLQSPVLKHRFRNRTTIPLSPSGDMRCESASEISCFSPGHSKPRRPVPPAAHGEEASSESRFVRDVNHCISKTLVGIALHRKEGTRRRNAHRYQAAREPFESGDANGTQPLGICATQILPGSQMQASRRSPDRDGRSLLLPVNWPKVLPGSSRFQGRTSRSAFRRR